MKNVLIGIFAGISALSLGYIGYSELSDNAITCPEFDKAAECSKDVCDRLYGNDENIDDEVDDNPIIDADTIYDKNGKELYNLTVYNASKIKTENVKINNKTLKLENRDDSLYVNNKIIGYTDILYVTNNYIVAFTTGCQVGMCDPFVIDENGNTNDLAIDGFNGDYVYLAKNGDLISLGEEYCGLACSGDKMILRISYNNGKVKATTEKLK